MAADMGDTVEEHRKVGKSSEKAEGAGTDVEVCTPLNDAYIKHPLQNTWTLWFFKNDRTKAWEENQVEITSFATVEDFWALYNYIEVASHLPAGTDYSLFKKGIKPMWEDDRNKKGGRWLLNLNKSQRFADLDNLWLEVLLCLIGEAFEDESEEMCGAVVNIRNKGDKIGVWTATSEKPESVMKIG
ncbi:unnamed protein product [Darwinula stevensoni]|uniref:eIF-4F 25 kDa subunit n=1 Tax=Darwinula stevensoni TaxID=69355 RepID=A0A7R9A7R3_9CRUS|nr:unnamed protein product [Darwinula stevensoni]CAG0893096.1 unnamed protein product [Darwinula stevensoni]